MVSGLLLRTFGRPVSHTETGSARSARTRTRSYAMLRCFCCTLRPVVAFGAQLPSTCYTTPQCLFSASASDCQGVFQRFVNLQLLAGISIERGFVGMTGALLSMTAMRRRCCVVAC